MNGGVSQFARVLDSLERPTPNQAWLASIDSRKLSQAVADMRAEQEAASRNASRAGVGQ